MTFTPNLCNNRAAIALLFTVGCYVVGLSSVSAFHSNYISSSSRSMNDPIRISLFKVEEIAPIVENKAEKVALDVEDKEEMLGSCHFASEVVERLETIFEASASMESIGIYLTSIKTDTNGGSDTIVPLSFGDEEEEKEKNSKPDPVMLKSEGKPFFFVSGYATMNERISRLRTIIEMEYTEQMSLEESRLWLEIMTVSATG